MNDRKGFLQGGPSGLTERVVPIQSSDAEIKIPFRGGYEHFKATERHQITAEGKLPVYEWAGRTAVAE
ncbi:DUF5988 family protein [Nocardia crassostreae]|uniref:DUF5988 family protein n=1 Tax=Nocardia crassostreae TaxID=53428 RepID=UPI000830F7AB|nr:DUF5988 family protein [Nocardia crassostreae]